MKVPLLDLAAQYAALQTETEAAVVEVLRDGRYVLGPAVTQLEAELAGYLGVKHVIGCASGSDALLLALMALEVGPGDEVITTPFTFFATVSAITRLGAKPVLVDIDPATFNIQVSALRSQVSARTKAIIPVHLFGQCAAMEPILGLGIPVVEDACQAIGAKASLQGTGDRRQTAQGTGDRRQTANWQPSTVHWRRAGAIGAIGTFSFYPTKNLGGPGDGGALSTNDDALAAKLRKLRNHGMEPRYYHGLVGINSRLDSLQAAALRVKLPHLDSWAEARRRNAALYDLLLEPIGQLQTPVTLPDCFHVYNQYTIRVRTDQGLSQRDALRAHLQQAGIGTEIYYPVPLHMQECFKALGYGPGDFPESEKAAREVLSLPICPELSEAQIRYVADTVSEFLNR